MYQNHLIYKGYRLTARVSRIASADASHPAFTATVTVEFSGGQDSPGDPCAVPLFATGGSVSSPYIAVDAAINHGRHVVDAYAKAV